MMMLSSVADMMMMMPPQKKARHNGYSYLESDRIFLNSNGSGIVNDFSRRSIFQSSHGPQTPRELLEDLEEFRDRGPRQSRVVPSQGPSSRTVFHPSQETSVPTNFSLDFSAAGPYPGTQRASRDLDFELPSLRNDTIELPRRTTTTPSCGAAMDDAPLDLSIFGADNLRRILDDQTFEGSENSTRLTGSSSGGGIDFRSESNGRQRSTERTATPQLPLFVNLENSRLESIQLELHTRSGHDTTENQHDETKLSDSSAWQTMRFRETESVVELPPRRQKNAIDMLRAHLERRQEGRPSSSTAYTSLNKHLADIEETGNRYEAVHGTMFGELQEAKTTRSKTSFLSETEADVRGPSYSSFHSEKVTLIGTPEEPGQQKRCLSELNIRGSQRKQHHGRLKDTDVSDHASEVTRITRAGRPYRPEAEPEPDSPSSHSLPDVSRIPAVTNQSQTSRRPASIGTGFPSSEYLTKTDVAPVMMDTGSNGGGRALESCSPDQSTNYMNYSADNLPAIIATARLDDDCEFTSSFADTLKETITARDHHHPIDKSPNGSLRNRKSVVRSGSVGTGLSSSPEPPSSTFEDELVTDRKQDEDNAKPAESAIPCKICQDVANGFHYGVWSCEGCKAFFKRSITGSAKYVCPADNNCTINRLRKKSCQACRLRKCYEYGMSPGNCRGENGSKMRKRKLLEANRKEDMRNVNIVNGDDGRMNVSSNQNLSGNVFLPAPAVLHNFHNQSTVAEPASGPVNILQHLLAVERPIRFADFVDARTAMDTAESERIQLLTSITKLVSLQLMDVVTWSRSLPGFRNVNLNIRTHLLASSWSEILLLTNAFYSLQCTNAIAIAPNLHLTKERCEVIGMVALYNRLMAIVKSFQQLALTHNEMLLMQALLLVNADVTAPQLIPRLDELRVRLMRSWHESCAGVQGQGHVDYDRIPQLLMLLPHIRHCSLLFQRFLADFKRDSGILFNGFLQEVTDGRYECDRASVLELLIEEEASL